MKNELRIEGIYDKRTIQLLLEHNVKDFGFDFCPRSFNFIQEHIFIKDFIPVFNQSHKIYLKFSNMNDLMINRIIKDLSNANINKENIYFEFTELDKQEELVHFQYNFFVHYSQSLNISKIHSEKFKGVIFDFSFLENLHTKNLLNSFISNFYTQNISILSKELHFILKADWPSNLIQGLFNLMDFNLLSLPINSNIEICYRNVDINKLKHEIKLVSKNLIE